MNVIDILSVGGLSPHSEGTRITAEVASGWYGLALKRSGESVPRLAVLDNQVALGPGTGSLDTYLQRTGAGVLYTPGRLTVGAELYLNGLGEGLWFLSGGDRTGNPTLGGHQPNDVREIRMHDGNPPTDGALIFSCLDGVGASSELLYIDSANIEWKGNDLWHAGNFNPATKSDTGHTHDDRYLRLVGGTLTGTLFLSAADARLSFWETDAPVNGRRADFVHQGGNFVGRFYNDAGTSSQDWLTVTRSEHAVEIVALRSASDTGLKATSDGLVFHTVWHAGNDGAGSGLDSDLLDGRHANEFVDTSSTEQTKEGVLNVDNLFRVSADTFRDNMLQVGPSFISTALSWIRQGLRLYGGLYIHDTSDATGAKHHALLSEGTTGNLKLYAFGGHGDRLQVAQFVSTATTGTAPMTVASSTVVANLNADLLDGYHASAFALVGHTHPGVYEPAFSKGNIIQGSGVTLSGTLVGRLYGPGDVTISATGAPSTLDSLTDVVCPTPTVGHFLKFDGANWVNSAHGLTYADVGAAASSHTHDASAIVSGTINSARIAGAYTGINTVGTLGSLTVSGGSVLQGGTTTSAGSTSLSPYIAVWESDPNVSYQTIKRVTLAQLQSNIGVASHTHDASAIVSGTINTSRLSGSYLGITQVGSLSNLTVSGSSLHMGGVTTSAGVTAISPYLAVWESDPNSGYVTIKRVTQAQLKSNLDIPTWSGNTDHFALWTDTGVLTYTGQLWVDGTGKVTIGQSSPNDKGLGVYGLVNATGGFTDNGVGVPNNNRTISAGTGLTGGGNLSADRTISLANTTVTPGSYGAASGASVPYFTVDAQGRITSAASRNVGITDVGLPALPGVDGAYALVRSGGSFSWRKLVGDGVTIT